MPSRRTLLRNCGLALSLGIAGCLGTGGDEPGATGSTTDAGTTTAGETPTGETERAATTTLGPPPEVREVDPGTVADRGVPRSPTIESDTYEPFRGFVVGERPDDPGRYYETPHVWIWNLTGEAATMTVSVTTGGAEALRVEAEFPTGAPLAVEFREKRAYEVDVSVGDRERTATVEPDRFFCNATGTDVRVRPDDIEAGTVTTQVACPTTTDES